MISRGFLLVLLVLSCLQSFTTAENSNVPATCCFRYQRTPISIKNITEYKETDHRCPKPAVIFTLKNSRRVCVDPEREWVKKRMKKIDQILNKTSPPPPKSPPLSPPPSSSPPPFPSSSPPPSLSSSPSPPTSSSPPPSPSISSL